MYRWAGLQTNEQVTLGLTENICKLCNKIQIKTNSTLSNSQDQPTCIQVKVGVTKYLTAEFITNINSHLSLLTVHKYIHTDNMYDITAMSNIKCSFIKHLLHSCHTSCSALILHWHNSQ